MNIAELRALRAHATRNQWVVQYRTNARQAKIWADDLGLIATLPMNPTLPCFFEECANRDLIAAAVNALGPLLDIAEAAQEVLDIPSTQHVHRLSVAVVKFLEEPCSTHG